MHARRLRSFLDREVSTRQSAFRWVNPDRREERPPRLKRKAPLVGGIFRAVCFAGSTDGEAILDERSGPVNRAGRYLIVSSIVIPDFADCPARRRPHLSSLPPALLRRLLSLPEL